MPRRLLKNRTIEVILIEFHKHLGERFEIVKVKPIYARNVLLPKGIAVLANADMLHKYKKNMKKANEDIAKKKELLNDFLSKVQQGGAIVIKAKVNENGVLYSKLHSENIAQAIEKEYNQKVDVDHINMKKIVELGEYTISYKYKDLEKQLLVVVQNEKDEKDEKTKKAEKDNGKIGKKSEKSNM